MKSLKKHFDKETQDHINSFINLWEYCISNNIEYSIFTNAPYLWVKLIIDNSSLKDYFKYD